MVIAGKEYGSGSSRDWAAKGTLLLGVKAVLAESFERIHRSNLVNMGVLPLEFKAGQNAASLKLTGRESLRHRRHGGDADSRRPTSRSAPPRPTARVTRVHRARPHRHARGTGRVSQRRDSAVRAASTGEIDDGRWAMGDGRQGRSSLIASSRGDLVALADEPDFNRMPAGLGNAAWCVGENVAAAEVIDDMPKRLVQVAEIG